MNNLKLTYLPLEEKSRAENQVISSNWNNGCYNFLLQRTESHFNRIKTKARRLHVEAILEKQLPMIDDATLLALFKHASHNYQTKCSFRFEHTGFQKTFYEEQFLKTLEKIVSKNSEFKYLEIYPSNKYSRNLIPQNKMVIGTHVPDFIVFGLKHSGYSSVVIEVDGDSHVEKYSKDQFYYDHLQELGIFCWSIPNDKVTDETFIHGAIREFHRQRSGALDRQIRKNKRDIWCKTIACNLTLNEIEIFIQNRFDIQLNLIAEAAALIKDPKCPRKIKSELKNSIKHGGPLSRVSP